MCSFSNMYPYYISGRLVIVKFVTLARYHQRFPDALTASAVLKPSGQYPTSLQWSEEEDEPAKWPNQVTVALHKPAMPHVEAQKLSLCAFWLLQWLVQSWMCWCLYNTSTVRWTTTRLVTASTVINRSIAFLLCSVSGHLASNRSIWMECMWRIAIYSLLMMQLVPKVTTV